jgi:hypothetical protein
MPRKSKVPPIVGCADGKKCPSRNTCLRWKTPHPAHEAQDYYANRGTQNSTRETCVHWWTDA